MAYPYNRTLLSGDAQSGTDKLLLSGDAQSGTDDELLSEEFLTAFQSDAFQSDAFQILAELGAPVAPDDPRRQRDWPVPPRVPTPSAILSFVATVSLALTVVSPPFSQTNWPNPRGADRSVDLLTWVRSRVQPPVQNAQRNWPNPIGPARSIDLLSWSQSWLVPKVGAPFYQSDWPNPRGRYTSSDVSFQASPPLSLNPVPPFPRQLDWPNPRGPRAADVSLVKSGLATTTPVGSPFNQEDWPVPRGKYTAADVGFIESGLATTTDFGKPFVQNEWPVPRGPAGQPWAWLTWHESHLTIEEFPRFAQYDWQNPRGPKAAEVSFVQRGFAALTTPAATPFHQNDWPNPIGPRGERGFTQTALTVSFVAVPLRPIDWQNPRGRPPVFYHVSVQSLALLRTLPSSRQLDWPNPQSPRRLTGLSWEQTLPLPKTVGAPFAQDAWPNPTLSTQRNPDWVFKSPLTVTFVAGNKPFTRHDQPNPTLAVSRVPYSITYTPFPLQAEPPATVIHLGPLFWDHAPGFDDEVKRQQRRADRRRAREAREAYQLRLILERLMAGLPALEAENQIVLSPAPPFRLREFMALLGTFADTPLKLQIQKEIQEQLDEEDDIETVMLLSD